MRRAIVPSRLRRWGLTAAFLATVAAYLVFGVVPGFAEVTTYGPPQFYENLGVEQIHATRAAIGQASLQIGSEGAETPWRVEYATSKSGPWIIVTTGICPARGTGQQIYCFPQGVAQHLVPDTHYYARVAAENQFGPATEIYNHAGKAKLLTEFITTSIAAPEIPAICERTNSICGTRHTTSLDLEAELQSNGAETEYAFEYATVKGGPFKPIPLAVGRVTVAEDFATPKVKLEGLNPETVYYVRVRATNEAGEVSTERSFFTASTHPEAGTVDVASLTGTSAHVVSNIEPDTLETTWRAEYAPAEAGDAPPPGSSAWTVAPGTEGTITAAEAGEEGIPVAATITGLAPSTTYYVRFFAENKSATSISTPPLAFETAGAPLAMAFAVHTLDGEAIRVLGYVEPHGYDTHYHFEYVDQEQYEKPGPEGGFAKAASGPALDLGAGIEEENSVVVGFATKIVDQDLPNLEPGKSYRYRIVATSTAPGDPVIDGREQSLTIPATPASGEDGGSAACPNQQLRTGASARLPDCRAYELLTPADKEGTQEIFNYGAASGGNGGLVGEDGNHLMFRAPLVEWGSGPSAGQSPYFFARTSSGWQMTAASVQPETSVDKPEPLVYSPDLTQFGFESSFVTSPQSQSFNIEYKVGPPGGPYTTFASVPVSKVPVGDGLVAASEDFGKLVLQVEDHTLLGHSTGTISGNDLYEYSAGRLSQVNVLTGGAPIGSCGAKIVHGEEEGSGIVSSPHAVSADGSRVFFEAVPGSNCHEPSNLYMRVGGAATDDIGAYRFLAANAPGTEVLLEKLNGETHEFLLYGAESASVKQLKSLTTREGLGEPVVSDDLSAIYFGSTEQLTSEAPPIGAETGFAALNRYRYDIATETLRFIVQEGSGSVQHVSPDGRYYYFESPGATNGGTGVVGVPGGGPNPAAKGSRMSQVYRYDSAEDVVECMSCASPFDPEPKLGAFFGPNAQLGRVESAGSLPGVTLTSADGDFAFFETPAALVPQDVDGEVAPETNGAEHPSLDHNTSLSSDVYEWRRDGVDGCAHIQGCLALITSGRGGFLNLLIGASPSGRDVFFSTASQLLAQDNDSALDIYDARVDGGFPPSPPPPVECEGDACSAPAVPPSDTTPSSFTFTGAGNVIAPLAPLTRTKARKSAKCPKSKTRSRGGCVKKRARPRPGAGKSKKADRAKSRSHTRGGK